jgi:membrane peptidoglycan carboxypeptidase
MYLNEISYGSTNYGIEAAARSYFNKNASDLTLAESATLAAMLPQPSYYLRNTPALKERRNVVLRLMNEQGFITQEQLDSAQKTELVFDRAQGIINAAHFVVRVTGELNDQFGERVVDTSGFKVITTLDYDKQLLAEKIVKEQGDKFVKDANANNAALISIDPKTSQILALVGSRDFYNKEINGQFDVISSGRRQPGSSFKPFVYLAI